MNTFPKLSDAKFELSNGVAMLTMCRHDVRNVLTGTELINDIEATIDWINSQRDVSVLVITGDGSAFCAGGNVKEMLGRDTVHQQGPYSGTPAEVSAKYQSGIQRIPKAFDRLQVPSIAAINGPAIGAGFDLALMCDIRLASDNAVMGETFLALGLISGVGGAWWLTQRVGSQIAAEMTLTARVYKAEEALARGIVLRVTAHDQLQQQAQELAQSIAQKPPNAVRWNKQLLRSAQSQSLSNHLDECATLQGLAHNQEDHIEAVSAFIEKRAPKYLGR